MQGLAVATAFVIGLTTFVCSRLIQSRGKLSLRITILVLPLVTAIICFGLMQLNPYRVRHQTNSALKQSGLTVRQRRPEVDGEWYRDSNSGIVLPYWLIRMCGDDAMSDTVSVTGPLASLQAVDVDQLHLPKLRSINLDRSGAEPKLSVEHIAWLSKLEKLNEIKLEFEEITGADMPAIEGLHALTNVKSIGISSFLDNIGSDVDLSKLPPKCWLQLSGSEVSLEHAKQLSGVSWLELRVNTISAEAIALLSAGDADRGLAIHNCVLDEAAARAISKYTGSLTLINCKFPVGFAVDDQPTGPSQTDSSEPSRLWRLCLNNTPISDAALVAWLRRSNVGNFQTDGTLSTSVLEQCQQLESLQWIYYRSIDGEFVGTELKQATDRMSEKSTGVGDEQTEIE